MRQKLYVGNISQQTTEAGLRELFAQAGSVGKIQIITNAATGLSKGFGFVEMNEGGGEAIAEFNGKDFNGRPLTVHDAGQSLFLVVPFTGFEDPRTDAWTRSLK